MSYLYAVQMLIPGDVQPIKIGFSINPQQRKREYSGGPYRCKWLGEWPGDREDEADVHDQFRNLRLHGEWFHPTPDLLALIAHRLASSETLRESQQAYESATEEWREEQFRRAGEVLARTALAY